MAKFVAVNWRDLRNPDAGGAEVHFHEILKRLVSNGHEVTYFVSNFRDGAREDYYDGIRVIRRGSWYNANYVIPYHVRSYVRKNPCDLVLEDINKIPFFLPLLVKPPVLAIVPHLFGTTVFRETNALFAAYVYSWERLIPWVYRRCRFAVISPSTKTDLIGRGIDGDRIDVVMCGLDHTTYRPLGNVERFTDPTIVHFGRIRKYKSIDVVIAAFALIKERMPTARLLIIGDGPEKKNLVDLVDRKGLGESIKFLGAVGATELVKLLNQSHLFLNASPKEGWGLTVVEANACGLPVVASRRPGLQDSVKDGQTGYLVEYGDPRAFADKALELLEDREKWENISRGGLEWARSLTWDRTGEEMERIFLGEIVAKGRTAR
ncbi:MAG: glycosyltransferase family 4 protein [Candidatus Latescibacterota bacterium]|nr:MAG: glycosyltransferase family 4 protein [Candidatus Latescibacterota bacterium]